MLNRILKPLVFTAITALLIGCSPQFHFSKFQKKGGKITPEKIIDSVEVLIKGEDGKDSLIYIPFEVKVDCPDVPKTNVQIRQENRTERQSNKYDYKIESQKLKNENDSLKRVNKRLEIEAKQQTKQTKQQERSNRTETRQENRTERAKLRWWLWLGIGYISAHFLRYVWLLFKILKS